MKKNFCDRCGKEMKFHFIDRITQVLSLNYAYPYGNTYDLCKSCITDFKQFMEKKENDTKR